MRKLYNEFFYIPKYGKIREKVMLARVAMTVVMSPPPLIPFKRQILRRRLQLQVQSKMVGQSIRPR